MTLPCDGVQCAPPVVLHSNLLIKEGDKTTTANIKTPVYNYNAVLSHIYRLALAMLSPKLS